VLVPNDLLQAAFSERIYPGADAEALKAKFLAAGKLQMLSTQMTWVFGNLPECQRIEMFPQALRTVAPITGDLCEPLEASTFEEPVPTTVEEWIGEQNKDLPFLAYMSSLDGIACRQGLYLYAPDDIAPRILVPPSTREPLIRFTHHRMFHLGHAKVAERLLRSYFWPSLRKDTRTTLNDCAVCEIEKARQNLAHGLFRARPNEAPRSRYAMDFQGQGTAITGETEALAIIDTTARYVTIIPLKNRQVQIFLQPFLDEIVFRHGPPAVLHCDEAPEFMSDLMAALMDITETTLTTTLGHNARSNGDIEVFWRYWNRCMRMLPDDQYRKWPRFSSRIAFAYNTAAHQSIGGISPFEIYCGVTARDNFSRILTAQTELLPQLPNDDGDMEQARLFALAVKTSTTAFIQLAKTHDEFMKAKSAAFLNQKGFPRAFAVGDLVKVRFPPTKAELDATGRRLNHVSSWRGPCKVIDRLSTTTYHVVQQDNLREYERAVANLLPWKASTPRKAKNAEYDIATSTPFVVDEFIAVRDEPAGRFYLAKVTRVLDQKIIVHYYGCRNDNDDLKKAKFLPGWHFPKLDYIHLLPNKPPRCIRYSGVLDLNAMDTLLVARDLGLTAVSTLNSKSRRLLMPVRDELFIYQ
jgi:hypothetical protein